MKQEKRRRGVRAEGRERKGTGSQERQGWVRETEGREREQEGSEKEGRRGSARQRKEVVIE